MGKGNFLLLIISLLHLHLSAQQRNGLLKFVDTNEEVICFDYSSQLDSSKIHEFYSRCVSRYHQSGFLEASIDSVIFNSLGCSAFGIKGNRYNWTRVSLDSTANFWFTQAKLKTSRFENKTISANNLLVSTNRILNTLENKGYPFGSISFENTIIEANTASTNIMVKPGPRILLDTLYVKGNVSVSQQFIEAYLGFKAGDVYNHYAVSLYDKRLNQLGFVTVIRPSEIEFIPGRARIYTYIINQIRSQFSGLVGFSSGREDKAKLKLTGDVNLRLVNTFKQGEQNILRWQAMGEGSQRLNVSSSWAYLMGTKLGLDASFSLFRRDTTYLNINPVVALSFFNPNGSSIGLTLDHRRSSTIASANSLYGNYSAYIYKVSLMSGLYPDYLFPVDISWYTISYGLGQRVVAEQYVNQNSTHSTIGELKFNFLGYKPVHWQNFVLFLQLQGKVMHFLSGESSNPIFWENEQYQIGGHNSLRGFNQESIITNAFGIMSIELQYRIQNSINFFLFYDKAAILRHDLLSKEIDWPMGTGFGLQVASPGGIFSLSYALGRGMGESLIITNAKIHFGFIANF